MTKFLLQFLDVESRQKDFGAWLRQKRKESFLSMEALGRKVGMSKQYISVLERAANHALTGKPVTPDREKVVALAKALRADPDEALKLAGYASEQKNLPDFLYEIDFSLFDAKDLQEIDEFLKFKLFQKGIKTTETPIFTPEDAAKFAPEFTLEELRELGDTTEEESIRKHYEREAKEKERKNGKKVA